MLRIIATFILIYLAFRLFTMYLLPYVMRWYMGRIKRKFYEQNPHLRQQDAEPTKRKKGVNIHFDKTAHSDKSLDDIGEYIDYEDVEDNSDSPENK